ncbi:MAG TPA: CBS domain-containing protein [Bacteroidales bacterium]|nr:CBS domain-containing protein [Bacteroidales bacterium]
MNKVRDILERKGYEYYYIHPENSVFEALQTMAEKEIGAVMVVEDGNLAGMFTERDYARKIVLHGFTSREAKVGDFMTKTVITVSSETSIGDCMTLMTSKRIRHLPVLDKNKIIGLISIGDVVNLIIHQQGETIKDLENYIYGGKM